MTNPVAPERHERRRRTAALRRKLCGLAATALIAALTAADAPPTNQSVPEITFDSTDFLKLPAGRNLGEAVGVAVGRAGHVFVLHRGNTSGPAYGATAAQLLEFDAQGRLLREIGANLYAWSYAHAVRVDPAGNIWAADKGSDTVVEFDPTGRVRMVIGRKAEATSVNAHAYERADPPLPAVDGYFRQVTDMAWDSRGNTYISDGYVNSRVAKVAPDGRWLMSWGSFGTAPGQFNQPHSIAVDAQDRVYVADRGNRRIQVFDTEGKLLKIITVRVPFPADAPVPIGNRPTETSPGYLLPGAPWAICITPKEAGPQVLFMADAWPGRIYKLSLDGAVLGWLGGAGKQPKQFGWPHELACPNAHELYVAEVLNWRVQKLTLRDGR